MCRFLHHLVIVKASSGPRYIVGCRAKLNRDELKPGVRVTLDMSTLTLMRKLPREVDPVVYHMMNEDPGEVAYNSIGGLSEQIRELREVRGVEKSVFHKNGLLASISSRISVQIASFSMRQEITQTFPRYYGLKRISYTDAK